MLFLLISISSKSISIDFSGGKYSLKLFIPLLKLADLINLEGNIQTAQHQNSVLVNFEI